MRSYGGRFLLAVALAMLPASAAVLPPGFEETNHICVTGNDLAQIEWTPDGDLFIASRGGYIWVLSSGTLTYLFHIPVSTEVERGINGLAVDPDYATNRRLWIYYTTPAPAFNRLSWFTYTGTTLAGEQVVLEGPLLVNTSHNAGDIKFAADGTLYVAMGDDVQGAVTAQNPFDIRGKILRIAQDGTAAPGNPFFDGTQADPRVWALGLRNPYRIRFQPGTGNLFIADVGFTSWEELNLGIAGANYGWPYVEGPAPAGLSGYVYPIHWYSHNGAGAAIIGGDFAEAGDFAPEYEGSYFFAEFVRGELYRMTLDAASNPSSVELFATGIRYPTDFEFGPDGALYYPEFLYGESVRCVKRIAWVGGTNRQPVAVATATPDNGQAGLNVTLDGTASYDPDPGTLTYSWDLGDGTQATDPLVNKIYPAGVYQARLTVQDADGGSDTTPPLRIVSGNRAPTATLATPTAGATYRAGDTIAYTGSATDPEEGNLPCSRFSWQVVFHHNTHAHPFLGPEQGACSGSFVVPDRGGETAADTWYEILETVGDSGSPLGATAVLTDRRNVSIVPQTAQMTFETTPRPDLALTLDTVPFTAPSAVVGVVNYARLLGAVDEQARDGHVYRWLSWSDGGAREHEIRTPAIDTTFQAVYGCDVIVEATDLMVDKTPEGEIELRWQPIGDTCLAAGTERYRIYAADTATPAVAPGSFPDDPPFVLVGVSATESFTLPPTEERTYFLVVGVGSDTREGPVGHY